MEETVLVRRGTEGSAAEVAGSTRIQPKGSLNLGSNETEGKEPPPALTCKGPASLAGAWAHGRDEGQPQGHGDRDSMTQGSKHLSSLVLCPQVLALNLGVQHVGGSGMQGPARS